MLFKLSASSQDGFSSHTSPTVQHYRRVKLNENTFRTLTFSRMLAVGSVTELRSFWKEVEAE